MDNIGFMLIGFISGLYCLFYICRKINKNKLNEEQIRKAIRKSIVDDLNNPHQFDDINIPTYEMFVDECITYLYKKISKTIPNNSSLELRILNDELHTTRVYNSLIDIYLANIAETIKRANKYENEAIEYHNTFGEDPNGEPTLHPKIKNNGSSIQEKYPSIQDLIKTGTVEDL